MYYMLKHVAALLAHVEIATKLVAMFDVLWAYGQGRSPPPTKSNLLVLSPIHTQERVSECPMLGIMECESIMLWVESDLSLHGHSKT